IDNEDGAYQATKYLLQQGHRRIAHIAQDPLIRVSQDRYNGYCKALKEFHVPIDMDLVLWPEVSENESTEIDLRGGKIYYDAGYRAMKTLLQRGVRLDAIFFGGDLIAFGAQKAIAEVGIEVPSQLSLIGFDDEIPGYYNLTGKQITTMRQPLSEAGYLGVKALIKRLDNPSEPPQKLILKTKLVKRDSCMKIL
ncbi:MAG: substrate-binding domain-containing protein, partial [Oscillospiraceae bacterium]